jgi:hypothetical protein
MNHFIDPYLQSARSNALKYETPAVAFHYAGEFSEDLSQAVERKPGAYRIANVSWKRIDGQLAGLDDYDQEIIKKIKKIRKHQRGERDGALVWIQDTCTGKWNMEHLT